MKGIEVSTFVLESGGDMMILASNSPRRRQLLGFLGLDFRVVPTDVDETPFPGETPIDYVVRLAATKARWVRDHLEDVDLIVAADTTVVDGDQILGKPNNQTEAGEMLRQLRGRTHQVYTSIALAVSGALFTDFCSTDVPMREYTDEEIQTYVDGGDPLDKAGSYAIQHPGFHPVDNLRGCYANVVGLPLCHLTRAFRKHGVDLDADVPTACQVSLGYKCPIFDEILRAEI